MFTPQRPSVIPSLAGYAGIAWIVCLTLVICVTSDIHLLEMAQAENVLAPAEDASNQVGKEKRELPSLTVLGNASRKLLRQEAVLKSSPEKNAAATALCDMYVVLRLDSRYGGSKMLQGDATRIRRRLISIAKRHENALTREGIPRPPNLSSDVSASIAAAIKKHQRQTAGDNPSQDPPAAGKHSDKTGGAPTGSTNHTNDDSQTSLNGNQPNGSRPVGGQNTQASRGAQAAAGIPDTGWQLVELIQRIIAPDFWESRGGPGSIRYFAMRKVLVVRATTDIHEQVRDLLTALR